MNIPMATYRDRAFEASIKSGFCEYNVSDVDWLFSVGFPKIKTVVILGSKVRAGMLYLSQYCERFFVISENEYAMATLRGVAEEEGLKDISFGLAGHELYASLEGAADYVAIFENLEDKNRRLGMLSLASDIISDKGIISFFLRGKAARINEKKELKRIGFDYSEAFWIIPDVWRPTWSGKFDERESFKIWLDVIDFYNKPPFMLPWVGHVILSRPGKFLLKSIWSFLYPLRRYLVKERYIFAGKKKDCFEGQLTHLLREPFVRKSKTSKEGRVLFFIKKKYKKTETVLYFSKLKQYEPLLLNELARNIHSICPVTLGCLEDGTAFLVSDFISGERLNIYSGMDKETISWLVGFQEKTFSGYWKEEEWRLFISGRTNGCADRLTDHFLKLIGRENRAISIVAEHGDFGYLNILKVKDKRCILDWEYYNERGDEFFDIGYFLLNMYTEKLAKGNMALRDFVNNAPEKDYMDSFMKAKKLKNIDTMICAITIAAIRTKYQSLYYTSVKDSRYWVFDSVIRRLSNEVFSK